jgi:hypothetical protein
MWSHEYFHRDTGAGLGASHQTDWTSLDAELLLRRRRQVRSRRQVRARRTTTPTREACPPGYALELLARRDGLFCPAVTASPRRDRRPVAPGS